MANHKSALKRERQTKKKTFLNKGRISRVRTFIRGVISSLGSGKERESFVNAQSEIQRGVTKGVLHRNTASRKISRLSKLLKSAETK